MKKDFVTSLILIGLIVGLIAFLLYFPEVARGDACYVDPTPLEKLKSAYAEIQNAR